MTPPFIRIVAAGDHYGTTLYGLTADGAVYQWLERDQVWMQLKNIN